MSALDLRTMIREVDDFPTPGVGFKDITPLLADPGGLKQTIGDARRLGRARAARPDRRRRGARVHPRRRHRGRQPAAASCRRGGPGKLPPETVGASYFLEYGENALEVHPDLIPHGARVVIHDDVLATGGTVEAICGLVERLGGVVVGACFIIELTFLGGRERLEGRDVHALITY